MKIKFIKINRNTAITEDSDLLYNDIIKLNSILLLLYRRIIVIKLDLNTYTEKDSVKLQEMYNKDLKELVRRSLFIKKSTIEIALDFMRNGCYSDFIKEYSILKSKNPEHTLIKELGSINESDFDRLKDVLSKVIFMVLQDYIYYSV